MTTNPVPPSDPSNLASTWLERFLAVHPGGGLAEFDTWADDQAALSDAPELRDQARKQLESRLGAGELPAVGLQSVSGSVFGRGGKRRERKPTAAPGGEALQPGRVIGSFTLTRFIASGGMGQVWEAEDAELRRKVALKLVLPDRIEERSLEMFAREARAGGRLSHPNLVTTLAYGSDDGLSWIAQELVEGSWTVKDSLDALRSEDTVPKGYYREVAELVAKVADGMQMVHDAGVIHRDLKPQNILVATDDTPKVTDFGLARVSDDSFLSQSGDFAGTWAYMSPEQVTAKRMGLDHRTDIFSLGVVLYELLTLRRPFEGDTTHQIAQEIIYAEPPDATKVRSQCPHELAVIAGKALEKLPGDRYGSMAELAADLRRHLADEPILARPPGPLVRGMKWVRRHPAISSAGAIASVALVVVSLLLAQNVRTKNLLAASNTDLEAQTRVAEANEAVAEAERERAESERERAERERADVLRLSAQQDLADLLEEQATLWPASPENLAADRRWIAEAEALIAGLPRHLSKREELRALALPRSEAQREADRLAHSQFEDLQALELELESRRRALSVRRGEATVKLASIDSSTLPEDRGEWNGISWESVKPDRTAFGQEARGLAIATEALTTASDDQRAPILDTIAWGRLALGDDEGALEASRAGLAAAGEEGAEEYQGYLDRITAAAEVARSDEGLAAVAEEVATLEVRIAKLDAALDERIEWNFPADEENARWWNAQLIQLIDGLESLRDVLVAADVVTSEYGWSVGKRLVFAERLELGFAEGGEYDQAWAAVLPVIRASHPTLADLTAQLGLLPIGMDPESGLWEFAHLATGEPAVRGADGRLSLTEETGLVFVLIAGGTFLMGAQKMDPEGDNYDPQAQSGEGPVHPVTLSPYFLSKYEMTQGQWKRSTAVNPSSYGPDGTWSSTWSRGNPEASLLNPVEQVTWTECMALMARLELELPSEAQWENGCRAGTGSVYWSGDELETLEEVGNIKDQYALNNGASAWTGHEAIDDGNTLHGRVGSYRANAFGLHDVHGNVLEWCRDGYESGAYVLEGRTDPLVSGSGSAYRVNRGGSFNNPARIARSAIRSNRTPEGRNISLGLRPAKGITADNFTPSPRQSR